MADRLETETRPKLLEVLLKGIASATTILHLAEDTESRKDTVRRISSQLETVASTEYGSPKCARLLVEILYSLMPTEEASTVCPLCI